MKTKTKKAAARKSSKPAKGLSQKEKGPIKKKLLEMRQQLLKTVKEKKERDMTPQDIGDEADQASHSVERELLFELTDNERTMLDQIEAALRRMEKGTYGTCESCRKPIARERIRALPFARYCIACQSRSETAVIA